MDALGVKQYSSESKQYVLYYITFNRHSYAMVPDYYTRSRCYFPSADDAENVRLTLNYFFKNWLQSSLIADYIRHTIFFHLEGDTYLESNDLSLNLAEFVKNSSALQNHPYKCNAKKYQLGCEYYDEYLLLVLRVTGFKPRIKKKGLFSTQVVETDEKTLRTMGLVVPDATKVHNKL